MKVENPAALRFIMQDDIYLLNTDKLVLPHTPEPEIAALANEPEPVIETQKTTFNYLGKNAQGFLVLVYYPVHELMNDAHLAALQSTLTRKGLSIDDVAVVNLSKYPEAVFEQMAGQFAPKKILILGNDGLPAGLPPLSLNKPDTIDNMAMLQTFSFGEMMTSNDNKKAFWDQVKNF